MNSEEIERVNNRIEQIVAQIKLLNFEGTEEEIKIQQIIALSNIIKAKVNYSLEQ